jgi:hypothetical protein
MPDVQGDCAHTACKDGQLTSTPDPNDLPPQTDPCRTSKCSTGPFGGPTVVTTNVDDGTPSKIYDVSSPVSDAGDEASADAASD